MKRPGEKTSVWQCRERRINDTKQQHFLDNTPVPAVPQSVASGEDQWYKNYSHNVRLNCPDRARGGD
jgi:hypothetical protein